MKRALFTLLFAIACSVLPAAEESKVPLRDPWEAEYSGDDATGRHVIALWNFTAGAETKDASGHGTT